MTSKNSSRIDNLAADQAMVDGIQKNQAKLPGSFPMEGQTMTLAGVTQVFQDRIATGKAVIQADNARRAAIKDDRDKRAQTRGTALAFRRLLIALFAQEPDVLGDFAVQAPKKAQRSTADKAQAAAKGMATREVLGTKGSRQKKAALQKATASSAASSASSAAPSAGSSTAPETPAAPEKAQPAPAPAAAPAPKPAS